MRGSGSFRHRGRRAGCGVGGSDVAWQRAGFVTASGPPQRRVWVAPGSSEVIALSFGALAVLRLKQLCWGYENVLCGFCPFFAPERLVVKMAMLSVRFCAANSRVLVLRKECSQLCLVVLKSRVHIQGQRPSCICESLG